MRGLIRTVFARIWYNKIENRYFEPLANRRRLFFGEPPMALEQILCALYVALSEAAGGAQARLVANRVLRDAITDRSVDNEEAIEFLKSLCNDRDDVTEPEAAARLEVTA